MRATKLFVAALVLAVGVCGIQPVAEATVLFDFEEDEQGWLVDWGMDVEPEHSTRFANEGEGALELNHHFRKDKEAIAIKAVLQERKDFTAVEGFKGFSAWIHIPKGQWWEVQMYVTSGENWDFSWGQIAQKLKPGWHRIFIKSDEISNPEDIRSIGVQVKNFTINSKTKIYVDQIEVLAKE